MNKDIIVNGLNLKLFCSEADEWLPSFDLSLPFYDRDFTYASDGKILMRVDNSLASPDEISTRTYPLKSIGEIIGASTDEWEKMPDIKELLENHLDGISPLNFESLRIIDTNIDVECIYCGGTDHGCEECDGAGLIKFSTTKQFRDKYHKPIPFGNAYAALTYLNRVSLAIDAFPGTWEWQQIKQGENLGPLHFRHQDIHIVLMPMRWKE